MCGGCCVLQKEWWVYPFIHRWPHSPCAATTSTTHVSIHRWPHSPCVYPLLPSQPVCCSHTPCIYPPLPSQPLCCHYSHTPCTLNEAVASSYEHAVSQVREIKSQLPEADIMFLEM